MQCKPLDVVKVLATHADRIRLVAAHDHRWTCVLYAGSAWWPPALPPNDEPRMDVEQVGCCAMTAPDVQAKTGLICIAREELTSCKKMHAGAAPKSNSRFRYLAHMKNVVHAFNHVLFSYLVQVAPCTALSYTFSVSFSNSWLMPDAVYFSLTCITMAAQAVSLLMSISDCKHRSEPVSLPTYSVQPTDYAIMMAFARIDTSRHRTAQCSGLQQRPTSHLS